MTQQALVFDASPCVALSRVVLCGLPCAYGALMERDRWKALGWFGGDHCVWCHAHANVSVELFAADVAAGIYDADGYTPAERRMQQRRGRTR